MHSNVVFRRVVGLTCLCLLSVPKIAHSLQPSKAFTKTSNPFISATSTSITRNKRSPLFFADATMSNSDNSNNNKNEEWTKPRMHNTSAFRSIAILGAIAAAGASTKSPIVTMLSTQATACIHLLSFATWFGTMTYTTFILGITMFKNLPRKTFGTLQSKLFPKYFALSSIAIVTQLVTMRGLTSLTENIVTKSTKALIVALIFTLINQFILEPISTDNMFKRYELDDKPGAQDTDEYKKLKADFGKFHGMSSLTNLIALCAAVAHGFYLSAAFV